jgi:hypothetical protein
MTGEEDVDAIASFGALIAMSRALKFILEPHSLYRFRLLIPIVENTITKNTT